MQLNYFFSVLIVFFQFTLVSLFIINLIKLFYQLIKNLSK